jgi:hypothetical protein
MTTHPFTPLGVTVAISVTTTTASGEITTMNDASGKDLRIYNAGSATAFLDFGSSGIVATTADMPVPSGAVEVISVGPGVTHVAAITASGTATLYITAGRGI